MGAPLAGALSELDLDAQLLRAGIELRPATRYDQIAEALGCHSELVESPDQLRPALDRAFSAGGPALVNVLTDPEVVYPRKAVLA